MLLMKSSVIIAMVIVFFFVHSFVDELYLRIGECDTICYALRLFLSFLTFFARIFSRPFRLFPPPLTAPASPRMPLHQAPGWFDSSVGRAIHRYTRGHGFESRWSLNVFFCQVVNNCDDHSFMFAYIILEYCNLQWPAQPEYSKTGLKFWQFKDVKFFCSVFPLLWGLIVSQKFCFF